MPRVVQSFVCEAAGERTITDDCDDFVIVAIEIASRGNPECRRDRRGRVPGTKYVVLTLRAFQEARDSVFLAQCFERIVASGEELVRIALVADVPYELITRCLERGVQRDGELDDAEARADVATGS